MAGPVKSLIDGLTPTVDLEDRPRVILAVDGLDKEGKTNFGFTAPKPLVYLDFDMGAEGVINRADNMRGIVRSQPFTVRPYEVGWLNELKTKPEAQDKAIVEAAQPVFEAFMNLYYASLKSPVLSVNKIPYKARSIVIDTGGELWELIRLAYLGKLTQVMPRHYNIVNGLMRDLVRAAVDSDVNLIVLHKLKSEWKEGEGGKSNKTGVMQREGFKDMSFLVQTNLLCHRAPPFGKPPKKWTWKSGEGDQIFTVAAREEEDDLGFRVRIGNCRHNPQLEGVEFENADCHFRNIAQLLLPDVDPSAWDDAI